MVTITRWSARQLAEMTGCAPNHATDVARTLTSTARRALLADPAQLVASGRPDRVAAKAVAFCRIAGRIAEADPEGLAALFRRITETATATAATAGPVKGPRSKVEGSTARNGRRARR